MFYQSYTYITVKRCKEFKMLKKKKEKESKIELRSTRRRQLADV